MKFNLENMGVKVKALAEKARKEATQAADTWKAKADKAAQAVADKCTEMTGRETSAAEVKKAALIAAGAVVLGSVALAVASSSPGDAIAAVTGTGDGWGSDFESQATKGFAEMGGSLNFYTPHVDSCGTVYSEPYSY